MYLATECEVCTWPLSVRYVPGHGTSVEQPGYKYIMKVQGKKIKRGWEICMGERPDKHHFFGNKLQPKIYLFKFLTQSMDKHCFFTSEIHMKTERKRLFDNLILYN